MMSLFTSRKPIRRPHIFVDSDGVIADFDTRAAEILGMPPREYEARFGKSAFWTRLRNTPDFYRNLPLMPDAHLLMSVLLRSVPLSRITFLTGCPAGGWAEAQKRQFFAKHFPELKVITCKSSEKVAHMRRGDVLIDDWPEHRATWIKAGGIFISHFDAKTSLETLVAHYPNILPFDW